MQLSFKSKERSMKRKLFVYMFFLVTTISITLLMGLFLFGRLGTTEQDFHKKLSIQSEYFTKNMENYWDDLASMNIALADNMEAILETTLANQGLTFQQLQDNPNAIYSLENDMIQPLGQYLERSNCSGAYVQLDTTINSTLDNAQTQRSGVYLQKTTMSYSKEDLILYRGIANIGKKHGIMPHRKWRQEFDITLVPDYEELKKGNFDYSLSNIIQLPYTGERIALLRVPLVGKDGTFYGLCGFEISQSWFKFAHPQPSTLNHLTCLLVPDSDSIITNEGFSTGSQNGFYYIPNGDLSIKPIGNNLLRIISKNRNYIGVKNTVKISKNQTYSTYVMILDSDYNRAIVKSNIELFFFTIVLLLFVFLGCSFFSQRFLSPILKGLEQLRKDKKNQTRYSVQEIDDLLDFLSVQDYEVENKMLSLELEMQENRKKLEQIENEHELIQREYDKAKVEVERLAKKREADVDEEEYKRFLECLATLTRKEKEILNLYVKGYSSKDILETLNITDNTLKYHNRNIYSKLGVKSRKQLLMYMTLLR